MAPDSEIVSWRIVECSKTAGIDVEELKFDELDNEICTVCCTSFKEFPYRTVVPCAHNNVCAKCTLRMRVFGDFNNEKHPYPMCPFCKTSWEMVAFIPLSWTIAINRKYEIDNLDEDGGSPPANIDDVSQNEWNWVFSRPMEYDDEIQCYFTDIHIMQKFIHIRSLYCLLCYPPKQTITNYNKIYYFHNISKLLGHLKYEHTSFMCQLCLNNANLFIDEQRIFLNNKKLLIDHERNGSQLQDQYGETAPHPFCTLCRQNFYNRDALFEHCEDSHCSCHLCKQSGILEYYANPQILTEHHRTLHHLCEHRECLAKLQPVVFDDPVLLRSHQLQAHRQHKPVSTVRTAFSYGDDYNNRVSNGTMNFSTMFSQSEISYLNVNRYGNQNDAQPLNMSEEQIARNKQRELHRIMDDIKRRHFPNQLQREKQLKKIQNRTSQLGLRHIPDAVAPENRETKNGNVIRQIKKTLISELNFKQFQMISHQYRNNKISSCVFFYRFKGLFEELCDETVWVDILIQMLALLRDGKKRRSLYEEYRDWVIGGRINKTTKVKSHRNIKNRIKSRLQNTPQQRVGGIAKNARKKKPPKAVKKTAATIVAGTYKAPTEAQLMSQRRAQKAQDKAAKRAKQSQKHAQKTKLTKSTKSTKSKSASKQSSKQKQKQKNQRNQSQAQQPRGPTSPKPQPQPSQSQSRTTTASSTATQSPVKKAKGQWANALKLNQPKKPKAGKKSKTASKPQPKVIPKPPPPTTEQGKKHWPTLAPKGNNNNEPNTKPAPKKQAQWVTSNQHRSQTTKLTVKNVVPPKPKPKQSPKKQNQNLNSSNNTENNQNSSQSQKKTKRGSRKSQKDKSPKKIELFASAKPIQPEKPKETSKPKILKLTPKGVMPHENKKKTDFNKANPWGVKAKSPPRPSPVIQPQKQIKQNDDQKQLQTQSQPLTAENSAKKTKSKQKPKQKSKSKQQSQAQKNKDPKSKVQSEQKVDVNEKTNDKGASECYFDNLNDALSELQSVYIKLTDYKEGMLKQDKVGLFLAFLFESLYPIFELNFGTLKYESPELTKQFRQHIYQTVYDQFWSKHLDTNNKELFNMGPKTIKLKESTFKLRPNVNILDWSVVMNLPSITQTLCTQLSSLYDMLSVIDDDTMDMSPIKTWLEMMDLPFKEIYPILLYIWFILDVEIPSPPYDFIPTKKPKPSNKGNTNKTKPNDNCNDNDSNNNISGGSPNGNRNRQNRQNQGKKKNNKKKQKQKPVVLFKMGGM